ncbi:MAG: hypothetical protein MHPSP_004508, partial [Paramarteilia canceri]
EEIFPKLQSSLKQSINSSTNPAIKSIFENLIIQFLSTLLVMKYILEHFANSSESRRAYFLLCWLTMPGLRLELLYGILSHFNEEKV